jgi:hypothetical protein
MIGTGPPHYFAALRRGCRSVQNAAALPAGVSFVVTMTSCTSTASTAAAEGVHGIHEVDGYRVEHSEQDDRVEASLGPRLTASEATVFGDDLTRKHTTSELFRCTDADLYRQFFKGRCTLPARPC